MSPLGEVVWPLQIRGPATIDDGDGVRITVGPGHTLTVQPDGAWSIDPNARPVPADDPAPGPEPSGVELLAEAGRLGIPVSMLPEAIASAAMARDGEGTFTVEDYPGLEPSGTVHHAYTADEWYAAVGAAQWGDEIRLMAPVQGPLTLPYNSIFGVSFTCGRDARIIAEADDG